MLATSSNDTIATSSSLSKHRKPDSSPTVREGFDTEPRAPTKKGVCHECLEDPQAESLKCNSQGQRPWIDNPNRVTNAAESLVTRNRPDFTGTDFISPSLRFGQLPNQLKEYRP